VLLLPEVIPLSTVHFTICKVGFFWNVFNQILSLRFNGHFPGEPGLAGVYWSKGWWNWWWQLEL